MKDEHKDLNIANGKLAKGLLHKFIYSLLVYIDLENVDASKFQTEETDESNFQEEDASSEEEEEPQLQTDDTLSEEGTN